MCIRSLWLIAAGVGLANAGAAFAEQWEERSPNPSFEGKTTTTRTVTGRLPEGWKLWGRGKVDVVSDPAHVRTGKQAVRLLYPSKGRGCRIHFAQHLPIRPGEQYELSVWVKGEGRATVFVWHYSTSRRFIGGRHWNEGKTFVKDLTDRWQQWRVTYAPDDDEVGFVLPGVEISPVGAAAYIDDFSFRIDRKRFPRPVYQRKATLVLKGTAPRRLFHNGRELRGQGGRHELTLVDGENVLGLETCADLPDGQLLLDDGRHVALDAAWRTSPTAPDGWTRPGFDDSGWPVAKVGKPVHCRQVILLNERPERAWVLGRPTEFFVPIGGVAYMMVSLQAPTAARVRQFRVQVDAPACLKLLNRPEDKAWGWGQTPPKTVTVTRFAVDGVPYRRYEFGYDPKGVIAHDVVIDRGWQMKGKRRAHAPVGPLFFQLKAKPPKPSYRMALRRIVNGNLADVPTTVHLRVMPSWSGTKPKRVDLYYYSSSTWPVYPPGRFWGVRYPDYIRAPLHEQVMKRGVTRWECANWKTLESPDACAMVGDFKRRGIRIGFARNSGMPYQVYGGDPPEKLSGEAKLLLAHPEHRGVWWSYGEKLVPGVWKHSVWFRWFNTKMLFDKAFIAKRKPMIWCREYMARGGPLWIGYWRKRLSEAKAKLPAIDFVHWDWEYANVGYSCFCPRCLEAFGKYLKLPAGTKLTPPVVARKHASEWMEFRAVQHAGMIEHFHKMLGGIGLEFELYAPSDHKELVEGLNWKLVPGHVDYLFAGGPGGTPAKYYRHYVAEADRTSVLFGGKPVTAQLICGGLPNGPADQQFPQRRKNRLLRSVTAFRGGVNEWTNVGKLDELNGVDCFTRSAVDIIVKYETYIADGRRAGDEFTVTGLRPKDDHMAFRLGDDKPVLLFAWNDRRQAKQVTVTWKAATASAAYTDGETGKPLGTGTTMQLKMPPHTTAVVECRAKPTE